MPSKTVTEQNRQILGISLDPESANAFKAEAARLGITSKDLFKKMWDLYQKQVKHTKVEK